MGFESVTYIGPVIEVKKVKKNVSDKEALMVNSKGEEFNNGEVYDPYTGEKLKEETRGDENEEFYEHWMDVYDDAVEDERYAHYVEDLDEDTFLSPEIDSSPKGYFHLFPNGKVHSVVSRHIDVEDSETISLDKVDEEDEVEKFKKKYSNALQFLEKFFGGNNVNVKFLVTGYAI